MDQQNNRHTEHPMPYRILWTWDSWLCDPFDARSYVDEYCRLIDFMVEWDYNGLIIWGFIDSRHGGEESARQIATYGKSRGVRVMPGVGAGGYGGFVTSNDHRYSIPTLLKQHPELRARPRYCPEELNDYWMCLYQQRSLDWLREGAKWLAENFDIGGVNIETNEMANIDICEHAREATEREPNRLKYAASFSDLALAVPVIFDEVKAKHPDAWITYATYEPAWWHRQEDAHLLAPIPEDAIAQWNIEMDANPDSPPPVKRNVSLVHAGGWSYHLTSFPPIWAFTQFRCFYPDLEQARQFARNQHSTGTDGFVLGNVGSHKMPDNEIAYIAYVEFARNPDMSIDEFSRKFISQLYGEQAEPKVKELMLRQTKLHQDVQEVWKAWARLLVGEASAEMPSADTENIDALESQLELAREAYAIASEGGRRRLDIIIQILSEYLAIARMSIDPELSSIAKSLPEQDALRKVAMAAREAGLPQDVYGYGRFLE